MFNRFRRMSDGRSDGALNVENNELNECAAIYFRTACSDEEMLPSFRAAINYERSIQRRAASLIKISIVSGPIPSNSARRFSSA